MPRYIVTLATVPRASARSKSKRQARTLPGRWPQLAEAGDHRVVWRMATPPQSSASTRPTTRTASPASERVVELRGALPAGIREPERLLAIKRHDVGASAGRTAACAFGGVGELRVVPQRESAGEPPPRLDHDLLVGNRVPASARRVCKGEQHPVGVGHLLSRHASSVSNAPADRQCSNRRISSCLSKLHFRRGEHVSPEVAAQILGRPRSTLRPDPGQLQFQSPTRGGTRPGSNSTSTSTSLSGPKYPATPSRTRRAA